MATDESLGARADQFEGRRRVDRQIAAARARAIAAEELNRLNAQYLADAPIDPARAVTGLGPLEGPERAAYDLEQSFGRLEDQPSWLNARQFAGATEEYAGEGPQWLMSPERYRYMQQGPGRAVDLLRGLRQDPESALNYWEQSKGAQTTRDGYTQPNYARYAGVGPAVVEAISSPLSGIGRYLQWQSVLPNRLTHGAMGADPMEAWGRAGAMEIANQRFRLGEVPVMDIADAVPGETPSQRRERFSERQRQVADDVNSLRGPEAEDLGRQVFGSAAPPIAGRALQTAIGFADATFPVTGLLSGLNRLPATMGSRLAANAAARTARISAPAARQMIERAARVFPDESVIAQGARAAGYRGVPASAYADALRPPRLTDTLAQYARTIGGEEGLPELAVEGGLEATLPQANRTYAAFVSGPSTPEGDEEFAARMAAQQEAATRAAVRMEALDSSGENNEIWNEFQRAQSASRPQWFMSPERYRRLNEAANAAQ